MKILKFGCSGKFINFLRLLHNVVTDMVFTDGTRIEAFVVKNRKKNILQAYSEAYFVLGLNVSLSMTQVLYQLPPR